MLDAAEELSAEDPEFASRYRSNYGYETIKWSQIVKDRHSLVLRTFPVSALSSSPSAKFAQLTELLNSGAITIEQFKRLYGMPDLEAENDVDLADQEIIDKNLDYMVTTGKYLAPEGTDSLALIVNRGAKFYNMLRRYEVPEDRKLLIMQYIDDAQKMLAESAAPAPPSGAPPQMNGAV